MSNNNRDYGIGTVVYLAYGECPVGVIKGRAGVDRFLVQMTHNSKYRVYHKNSLELSIRPVDERFLPHVELYNLAA